ncbi:UNVERIFIED_CONTAM: hypothetical protein K2H54_037875 [Gekko kuhli]
MSQDVRAGRPTDQSRASQTGTRGHACSIFRTRHRRQVQRHDRSRPATPSSHASFLILTHSPGTLATPISPPSQRQLSTPISPAARTAVLPSSFLQTPLMEVLCGHPVARAGAVKWAASLEAAQVVQRWD